MKLPVKAYVKLELRVVIRFLVLKGKMAVRIHHELEQVYGAGSIDVSNVRRWGSNFVSGWHSGVENEPRRGRLSDSLSPANIKHVRQLLDDDSHYTLDELVLLMLQAGIVSQWKHTLN